MSNLADCQLWPEAGVGWFSKAEETRIAELSRTGGMKRRFGPGALYYPRRPLEDPKKWWSDYWAKLRSLERAEGIR